MPIVLPPPDATPPLNPATPGMRPALQTQIEQAAVAGKVDSGVAELIVVLSLLPPPVASRAFHQVLDIHVAPTGQLRVLVILSNDQDGSEQRATLEAVRLSCSSAEIHSTPVLVKSERLQEVVFSLSLMCEESRRDEGKRKDLVSAIKRLIADHPWTVIVTVPLGIVLTGALQRLGEDLYVSGRKRALRRRQSIDGVKEPQSIDGVKEPQSVGSQGSHLMTTAQGDPATNVHEVPLLLSFDTTSAEWSPFGQTELQRIAALTPKQARMTSRARVRTESSLAALHEAGALEESTVPPEVDSRRA